MQESCLCRPHHLLEATMILPIGLFGKSRPLFQEPTPMTREFPKNPELKSSAQYEREAEAAWAPKIERPTVGRVVHYFMPGSTEPLAAIVAKVGTAMAHEEQDPYTVNLMVINEDGSPAGVTHIKHASAGETRFAHWDWMDYQKGQARKAEELEAKLKAENPPVVIDPKHDPIR